MGYTIWYEGNSDTALTDSERELVRENSAGCSLSEDAEGFEWRIEEEGKKLIGWTKPSRDMDEMDFDMEAIVAAVGVLDDALVGFTFKVTDDFDTTLYP